MPSRQPSISAKLTPRDKYLRRVYGITERQYLDLLERQGGGCAICGKTPEQEGRNLAVDHTHIKGGGGEVRGILCGYCNHRLVGRHKDPELLRKIALYVSQGTGWFTPVSKNKRRTRKRKRKR